MKWALLGAVVVALGAFAANSVNSRPLEPKPVGAGCCLMDGKCQSVDSDEGCDKDTYYMTGFCHGNTCEPS